MTGRLNGAALGVVLIGVPFFSERLLAWLHDALVASLPARVATSSVADLLVLWLATVALFSVVGVLVAYALRTPYVVWWAAALGLVYGVLRVAAYHVHYGAQTRPLVAALLLSCIFAGPALGTVLGVVGYRRFRRPGSGGEAGASRHPAPPAA